MPHLLPPTDFGATDVPASPADLAGARGGPAVQVPVDLGGVAVAYNGQLPGGLKLTGLMTARIFLGQITYWDDPAITDLNPGTSLPHQPITVVHRADGSGTTYIFSDYLSKVSPAFWSATGTPALATAVRQAITLRVATDCLRRPSVRALCLGIELLSYVSMAATTATDGERAASLADLRAPRTDRRVQPGRAPQPGARTAARLREKTAEARAMA